MAIFVATAEAAPQENHDMTRPESHGREEMTEDDGIEQVSGCDGDKRHWFGAHPKGLEVGSSYPCFIRMFETIKPADYGIEIWNVTRKTALQHFPVMNLDEVCRALS